MSAIQKYIELRDKWYSIRQELETIEKIIKSFDVQVSSNVFPWKESRDIIYDAFDKNTQFATYYSSVNDYLFECNNELFDMLIEHMLVHRKKFGVNTQPISYFHDKLFDEKYKELLDYKCRQFHHCGHTIPITLENVVVYSLTRHNPRCVELFNTNDPSNWDIAKTYVESQLINNKPL